MVALFNLWNLYQFSDDELAFDVTRANMPSIAEGTRTFVNECLARLNVRARVQSWTVETFRTQFISAYPDGEDWEDRWSPAWTFHVKVAGLAEAPANAFRDDHPTVGELDDTWVYDSERPDRVAYLIVCSRARRSSLTARADAMCEAIAGAAASFSIRRLGAINQLRVRWENVTFPDVVPILDDLVKRCELAGDAIDWRGVNPPWGWGSRRPPASATHLGG
jgi:hypothetical protein